MPSTAELVRAEELVRELYAADLRSAAAAARPDVAQKFLRDAIASADDDPAAEYVLLRDARRAAVTAGDIRTIDASLARAVGRFEADPTRLMAELLPAAKLPADADARRRVEARFHGAVDDAARVEQYLPALQLLANAEAGFRRANAVDAANRFKARSSELAGAHAAAAQAAAARKALQSAPDDAAAHLAVGRYLCLFRSDWDAGLPHLAKGADAALKGLAARDLAAAKADAREQVAVGGAWWDYAATLPPDARRAPLLRARAWYLRSGAAAGGLAKVLAAKRVAQIEADLGLDPAVAPEPTVAVADGPPHTALPTPPKANAPAANTAKPPPPPAPTPVAPVPTLRTVVYVLDCGESMQDEITAARAELRRLLADLQDGQGFNVILVQDDKAVPYRPGRLLGMSAAEREACLAWVDAAKLKGGGRSNVLGAVRAGLAMEPDRLYLLSDFDLHAPQVNVPKIRDANPAGRTKINAIVFGKSRDAAEAHAPLAQQIATDNGGLFQVVAPQ